MHAGDDGVSPASLAPSCPAPPTYLSSKPNIQNSKPKNNPEAANPKGKPERHPQVRPGIDRISLQARTTSPYQPAGTAPFNIAIVYEDDSMAIVHKPRGVCSHPSPGGMDGNMTMRFCVPYWVQGAPEGSVGMLWRPMLVHRLDKETEGLQVQSPRRTRLPPTLASRPKTLHLTLGPKTLESEPLTSEP